jgi:hypothetical protein
VILLKHDRDPELVYVVIQKPKRRLRYINQVQRS